MAKKKAFSDDLLNLSTELMRRKHHHRPGNVLAITRRESLAPIDKDLLDHAGYRWLIGNNHFNRANDLFQQSIPDEAIHLLDHVSSDWNFAELVAQLAGSHFKDLDWKPRFPSKKIKLQATTAIRELLSLIEQGARFSNYSETQQLKDLLCRLDTELVKSERHYGGMHASQKFVLEAFAHCLFRYGLTKHEAVTVVEAIAPLFDFYPVKRSIQAYVKSADQQRRSRT